MQRKKGDPLRDLAVEIVNVFINLLRDDEAHDALAEVHDRLRTGLPRIQRQLSLRLDPRRKMFNRRGSSCRPKNK